MKKITRSKHSNETFLKIKMIFLESNGIWTIHPNMDPDLQTLAIYIYLFILLYK